MHIVNSLRPRDRGQHWNALEPNTPLVLHELCVREGTPETAKPWRSEKRLYQITSSAFDSNTQP
jgi:hypothetical protein